MHVVDLHPHISQKYPKRVKIAENLVGYANKTPSLDFMKL